MGLNERQIKDLVKASSVVFAWPIQEHLIVILGPTIFSPMFLHEVPSTGNETVGEGEGVGVGVGVGAGVADGLWVAVGIGVALGAGLGDVTGAADFVATPLFQTSLVPFLIHV